MHLTNKEPIRSDALAVSGCADAAGAPANEIEITPAMIEVGMDVYEDFSGSFGLEQLLMAVYIAMKHASPS
jgi:hypothetical protein